MWFQVCFFVVCLDIYLHAPLTKNLSYLWYLTTFVALALDEPITYYLSESFLLALLLKEYYQQQQEKESERVDQTDVVESKSEASEKVEGVEKVNAKVKKLLVRSLEMLEKNAGSGTVTCDGETWVNEAGTADLKVYSASIPGLSIRRFKVVTEVVGNRDEIYAELFHFDKRLVWDTALNSGKQLAEYDADGAGENVFITKVDTAAAGGGAVSSREMIDAGLLKYTDDGGLFYAQASLGREFEKLVPSIPKPKKNPIRAFTHPGNLKLLIICFLRRLLQFYVKILLYYFLFRFNRCWGGPYTDWT